MQLSAKYAVAGLVAASIGFLAPVAFAASGTSTNEEIAADTAVVSACDSAWDLTFGTPTYDATDNRYEIATVGFTNVDATACNGQTIAVTVYNGSNASLSSGTASISAASGTITLATPVSATDATGTASAIYE